VRPWFPGDVAVLDNLQANPEKTSAPPAALQRGREAPAP